MIAGLAAQVLAARLKLLTKEWTLCRATANEQFSVLLIFFEEAMKKKSQTKKLLPDSLITILVMFGKQMIMVKNSHIREKITIIIFFQSQGCSGSQQSDAKLRLKN